MANVANAPEKRKLSLVEQLACAWPIALIVAGGALGGACGGAAYMINLKVMQSSRSAPIRYGLCLLTGVAAIVAWMTGVVALRVMFPSLFAG